MQLLWVQGVRKPGDSIPQCCAPFLSFCFNCTDFFLWVLLLPLLEHCVRRLSWRSQFRGLYPHRRAAFWLQLVTFRLPSVITTYVHMCVCVYFQMYVCTSVSAYIYVYTIILCRLLTSAGRNELRSIKVRKEKLSPHIEISRKFSSVICVILNFFNALIKRVRYFN